MARRKKQGIFGDLIKVTALMPWWVGVLLAVIAFFGLHHVASMEISNPTNTAALGSVGAKTLYKSVAFFAQFILPLAFLVGAAGSVIGRRKREDLLEETAASPETDVLNGMTWQEFEMLVGEAYRRQGYSVKETGGGGADGGVDLVLTKNGKTVLVQCKQWKTLKVGVKVVRELYGVMAAQKAYGGVVVTSGVFTKEAEDFAAGKNIALIEGQKLRRVIQSVRTKPAGAQPSTPQTQTMDSSPTCPKCGGAMVKRVAKQGENSGRAFWGCATYPRCRGIVPITGA